MMRWIGRGITGFPLWQPPLPLTLSRAAFAFEQPISTAWPTVRNLISTVPHINTTFKVKHRNPVGHLPAEGVLVVLLQFVLLFKCWGYELVHFLLQKKKIKITIRIKFCSYQQKRTFRGDQHYPEDCKQKQSCVIKSF